MHKIYKRFWNKINKTSECWEWTGAKSHFGHGRFRVNTQIEERAHRFSWQLHYGNIPIGLEVCHKCDNPPCCNPEHLFLGTHKDNTQDMLRKSREVRGSKASWSKLKPHEVEDILADTRLQKDIAKQYGICQQSVSSIKLRKNWKILI